MSTVILTQETGDITVTLTDREHELVAYCDLAADKRGQFNYITAGDAAPTEHDPEVYQVRFFEYNDSWYDSHEFERISPDTVAFIPYYGAWHGVQTQSYFDAVLVRFTENFEAVTVGHASW